MSRIALVIFLVVLAANGHGYVDPGSDLSLDSDLAGTAAELCAGSNANWFWLAVATFWAGFICARATK